MYYFKSCGLNLKDMTTKCKIFEVIEHLRGLSIVFRYKFHKIWRRNTVEMCLAAAVFPNPIVHKVIAVNSIAHV